MLLSIRNLCLAVALTVYLILACQAVAQSSAQEIYGRFLPSGEQVIDVALYGSYVHPSDITVLSIDGDDRISTHWFRKKEGGLEKAGSSIVGTAVWRSGRLSVKDLIRAKEVPFFATRLTVRSTATCYHAILTALLSKEQKRQESHALYLIAEKGGSIREIVRKEYDQINQVILGDMTGDEEPEIAVEFTEDTGKVDSMDIWHIRSDSSLREVPTPGVDDEFYYGMNLNPA